jgi:hypothetical protein
MELRTQSILQGKHSLWGKEDTCLHDSRLFKKRSDAHILKSPICPGGSGLRYKERISKKQYFDISST